MQRHRQRIRCMWSSPLETQRAESLNPAAVKHWFDLVEKEIVQRGIWPTDIYGMDESGFPPSDQGKGWIAARVGTKKAHKQSSSDRENVTAVITICADGSVLAPLIIYKGLNMMSKWSENNVAKASYVLPCMFTM